MPMHFTMKNSLIVFLLVLIHQSCSNTTKNTPTNSMNRNNRLDTLKWFIGSWQEEDSGGIFTETWEIQNDSTWRGTGLLINRSGDTAFTEHLQLANINDTLWYIPTVGNQNGGMPVRFRQKLITDTSVVFENMAHDFPQRIIYIKKSGDHMLARVEGKVDGVLKSEEFDLTHK